MNGAQDKAILSNVVYKELQMLNGLNLNPVFNMMYSLNKPQKHNFNLHTKTRIFLNCLRSMCEASVEDGGGDLCSERGVWVSGS